MRAECYATAKHMNCPADDCGCGIYGQFKVLETFESILPSFVFFTLPVQTIHSLPIVVLTEHFGKVQIHERGLRSEYATVVGTVVFRDDLVTFDGYRSLAKVAANLLGVSEINSKTAQGMIDNSLAVNNL